VLALKGPLVADPILPRDAVRKRGLCCLPRVRLSLRLSVRHVRVLHPDG